MHVELKQFELFYASGGHGGPYIDLEAAIRAAMLRVKAGERYIHICPYDALAPGGYGSPVYKVSHQTCVHGEPIGRGRAVCSTKFPESRF